jgi:MerR family transcriptional regulator, thiopeptide resistance regulator
MAEERMAEEQGYRIGELAQLAGLSIRAVRYYDHIGLLRPSGRTAAGHRRYDDGDVQRLYRICLLRDAGLTLSDIAEALDEPGWALHQAMRTHLDRLDRQQAAMASTRRRLVALVGGGPGPVGACDPIGPNLTTAEILDALGELTMYTDAVQSSISILVYRDLAAAHAWLTSVFGLTSGPLERNDHGVAVHGQVLAGDAVIWLHPQSAEYALASPVTLGSATGSVAVMVEDVDAHHQHAVQQGAEVLYPPTDQPYGYREYSARDLEGGLWSFMKALA